MDNTDIETPVPSAESELDLRESIALASLEVRMLGEASASPVVDGRYVLLEEIGAGGMGVVRRAFDRELRRDVAMKFLRLGGRARRLDEARLQREARALARLSHPNIVTVYDVRATPDAFFVAMEFVEGASAHEWLRAETRSVAEILHVFLETAQGLAAAHAAGLVHRDFKPSNVMVGSDGRARVVDFGLARASDTAADPPTGGGPGGDDELTQPGWFMGTPAYAAPEQMRDGDVVPRTDQFSFCVSLFEALFRRRPFTHEQVSAMASGAEPPDLRFPRSAPRWLARALRRGLAATINERWPSMEALIVALDGRRRRRKKVVLGAGVAAAAAAFALTQWPTPTPHECTDARESIARVWNEESAQALAAAFRATDVPYAGAAANQVKVFLKQYVGAWIQGHEEACGGHPIALPRRLDCLERRRTELAALVEVLLEADPDVVRNARDAVGDLSSLERCDDPDDAASRSFDPRTADAAHRVERKLARATALDHAGRYASARDEARAALQDALDIGDAVLIARARARYGLELQEVGDSESAAEELTAAYFGALKVGARAVAADAASHLVLITAERLGRHDEALTWARHAHALLDAHPLEREAQVRLLQVEAVAHLSRADYKAAVAQGRKALVLLASTPDADPLDVAWTHNNLGIVLQEMQRYEEARVEHGRAHALLEATLGPDHPNVATPLNGLGGDQLGLGQQEEALATFRAVLVLRERSLGASHPDVATAHNNVGVVLLDMDRHDEAEKHYRAALAIHEQVGPRSSTLADVVYNLANVHHFRGENEEAITGYRRALDIYRQVHEGDHPVVAASLNNIGVCYQDLGDIERALDFLHRALRMREATLGKRSIAVAQSLHNIGSAEAARDNREAARVALERALEIADEKSDASYQADLRELLAQFEAE